MSATFALGIGTFCMSLLVSNFLDRRVRRTLSPGRRVVVALVLAHFQILEVLPGFLLLACFIVRVFRPEWTPYAVFLAWMAYNIYLLLKMRRIMGAFGRLRLPADFQVGFVLARMVAYTGLVSALLILYHGGHLFSAPPPPEI